MFFRQSARVATRVAARHRVLIWRRLSASADVLPKPTAAAAPVETAGAFSPEPVTGAVHRKSRDVWRRRLKWTIAGVALGAGAYVVNENFGTPEKTASFLFGQLASAQTPDARVHILTALQMGAAASDAVREGIVYCGGLAVLKDILAGKDLEQRRLVAAILMDISQNSSLTGAIAGCPGLLERIIANINDPNKEIAMNSLLTLTIVCGANADHKLRAFDAGALAAFIGTARNPDLDLAHVACTAIGSIVKGFPQPERLTASLSKKDRIAVVAAISQLGQSYVQQGHRSAAVDAFRTALVLDPSNPNLHNVLGQLLQMSGQMSEANDHFRKAIKFAPGLIEAQYNLALNLTALGNRADKLEAVRRMREALPYADPSHPNRFDLMFLLGKTLTSLDRIPEARRVYEEMVQLSPSLWKAHLALGRLYLKLDETDRALRALTAAALLQPHDSQVHYQLALCHYRANRLAEAAVECDKALEQCADGTALPNAYLLRGKLYAMGGHWASALDCFRRQVELRPDQPDGYYQVARALQNLGRQSEADVALCQTLDCWSRQMAALPPAAGRRFFEQRPADARILETIETRVRTQVATPEHQALVRKYNALRAAVN